MTWAESRARRRWQRELEGQIRALPTFEGDTPDGGPVEPLPRQLAEPPRSSGPADGSGGRPHERRRTILTVGVTVGLVGALVGFSVTPAADAIRGLIGWQGDRGDETTYAFLQTRPATGEPVTWSSCDAIRFVVNPAGAPDGWEQTLEEAMAAVTGASGLEFADDGTTDDDVGDPRQDRSGRALPVLISWTTPAEEPGLEGSIVGVAGPSRPGRAASVYDTGRVTLDSEAFARMEREGAEPLQRAIVMHELAHLVGLDHVDDERQLMHPTTTSQASFGNGDLEGLRRLGDGPCR